MAHALALRGAQVTVLDTASHSAAGASSLPAGLMAPLAGQGDNLSSQLIRQGIAHTTHDCERLLQRGVDWQMCGALYQPFGKRLQAGGTTQWQPKAAWVKPAALVRAWLATPGVRFVGKSLVQRIVQLATPPTAQWQVWGQQPGQPGDHMLASAAHIVLANATGAVPLLAGLAAQAQTELGAGSAGQQVLQQTAAALNAVAGQVIWGPWTGAWQRSSPQQDGIPHALNGNGHYIPCIQGAEGVPPFWLSGSTYEHHGAAPAASPEGIEANRQRLAQLWPASLALLESTKTPLHAWAGQRCTTRDRLPAVGPLCPPDGAHHDAVATLHSLRGLYLSTAMGSRALSFAALCGQTVAQHILCESITLAPQLQRAVSPVRFWK